MGRQLQKVWVGGGEPGYIPGVRGEWRQGWSLSGDGRVKVPSIVCGIILSRSVFERQGMGTGVSKRVWRRPTGWMGMRRWEKKAGGTLVTGLGDKRAEQTQWACRSSWRSVRLLGGSRSRRGPWPTSVLGTQAHQAADRGWAAPRPAPFLAPPPCPLNVGALQNAVMPTSHSACALYPATCWAFPHPWTFPRLVLTGSVRHAPFPPPSLAVAVRATPLW